MNKFKNISGTLGLVWFGLIWLHLIIYKYSRRRRDILLRINRFINSQKWGFGITQQNWLPTFEYISVWNINEQQSECDEYCALSVS